MAHARLASAAAILALLGAGCQPPDVGQRCAIAWGTGTTAPTPDTIAGDYLETGNVGCDNLVCIMSPSTPGSPYDTCAGTQCGYCSKPCVSNQDCYSSQTGLVCRQMVLDPAFIASLDPATRAQYLADIQFSSYCAVP